MADGGYCGIHATYPEAVIPRKRSPHQQLSPEDKEFNRKLGHDRVIVEKYFERLKSYWGILKRPLRIEKINIGGLLRILVCLTNLKILEQPMFAKQYEGVSDVEHEEELDSEENSEDNNNNNNNSINSTKVTRSSPGIRRAASIKRIQEVPSKRTNVTGASSKSNSIKKK